MHFDMHIAAFSRDILGHFVLSTWGGVGGELPRTDIKTKLLVLSSGCGGIATNKFMVKVPAKM